MKKLTLTTNKTVSNKTTNNNTKGTSTMKKLILAATLIVGAAFASFAAVVYDYNPGAVTINDLGATGEGSLTLYTFTFDTAGKYDLIFGDCEWNSARYPDAFGYYFVDGRDGFQLHAGIYGGNYSDYWSNSGLNASFPVDVTDSMTGFLGFFEAGDTIGIWINHNGYTITSTDLGPNSTFNGLLSISTGEGFYSNNNNNWFTFNEVSGSPLPGVWAALAIGGCAFLGRKIRKSIKK